MELKDTEGKVKNVKKQGKTEGYRRETQSK